jgi:3-dehydroquinate synthetase
MAEVIKDAVIGDPDLFDLLQHTQGIAEQRTQGITEQRTQGIAEQRTQGMAEQRTQGMAEQRTQGIAEQRTQGMAEQRTQGMAEQHTEGMTEGHAEGTTEGQTEGTKEGQTEGTKEGQTEGQTKGTTEGHTEQPVSEGETAETGTLFEALPEIIEACVRLKAEIVEEDERDLGRRRLLNLGHSFGHAIEQRSGYALLHGEAVAIGTAMACRAAVSIGMLDTVSFDAILELLQRFGLPTETEYGAEELYPIMLLDKKIADGKMNLILPKSIGWCEVVPVSKDELWRLLEAGCSDRNCRGAAGGAGKGREET